ncbi:Peptidase A24B, FlaK domain protein [Methanolacinia petrolearia DSM 11571]|uniref:Peptidase A24B, FlaK domain protein n=1 Tax=Methanolacinia petrolearia (strain DSM 11571 / OCM 486 / SEBR 4847) TaxID=679926 RepID=E1RIA4_METP4|nr:A24 family peptidase C-terminal domain-containing protein [Methanolacinia petrolearia]ADN36569.1 Peptidase A24B, FlaK domain protein [Methanolacinia petrolearia DSM 11571]
MTELLIISSLAIAITLFYASYLDIKQRRVPFVTWIPAIAVAGALVIIFYYLNYGQYAGIDILQFSILPFIIAFMLLFLDWAYTVYIKKVDSSELDKKILAETYISWFLLSIPSSVLVFSYFTGYINFFSIFALISFIFCIFLELISVMHLWGGADSTAMIIISSTIPFFPVVPLWGYPEVTFFFPMSVMLNAVLLNLSVPVGLFIYNVLKKNRAPLKYMFIGYPVPGKDITDHFGYIIEEFEENGDRIERKFLKFSSSIGRMVSGKRRMYTQDFRNNPSEYKKELELYKKAGSVWISFGVPFIIPILAGFLFTFFIGDIFSLLLQIAGVV